MTDELKGFEPVALEYCGRCDKHTIPCDFNAKLYPADQLAQVVQQRDELLAVLKEIANFEHPHCTTPQDLQAIAEATIAKVQP